MLDLDRSLSRPGASVCFAVLEGEAPPVVFLHGAGMDHAMFDAQAVAVHRAGHLVVTCDLRGHGMSSLDAGVPFDAEDVLDDLLAVHDELDLEASVIIGHSLGGNLAQAFTRRHPDRVCGLVAVDCTWNTGPLTALERAGLRLAAPSLALVPARRLPRVIARASAVTPQAITEIEAVFAQMSKRAFLDVWRVTAALVDPDPTYRCPVPVALVRGDRDRTGNIAAAMPAWADAEGIKEHVIPHAGHVVTLDAPTESTSAVLAAIDHIVQSTSGPGR